MTETPVIPVNAPGSGPAGVAEPGPSDAASPPPPESLDTFLGAKAAQPWRKWAIRGAMALAVLALALLLARCFGGTAPASYANQAVARGDLTVIVSATGNLKPVNQVDVGSEQSGLITQVFVDVNVRVAKGQVLATLDPSRLQDTVALAAAQLVAAQAAVAQTQSQSALAAATLARLQQVSALSSGQVPARTELDTARAQAASTIANLAAARAQVGVMRAALSTARINLSKTRILSPVNGVVLTRNIEPGQTVAASFNAPVLFTIAEDLEKMEVQVAVDEADVGQVLTGQRATFTVDAFPGRQFPARIARVNLGANVVGSATGSNSAAVVAYTALLAIDNPGGILRPGMTATADILTQQVKGSLLVPNAALRFSPGAGVKTAAGITSTLVPRIRRGGGSAREVSFGAGSRQTVYVLAADGNPQAVDITIGASDGAMTVVTGGGLQAGMKVITGQLASGQVALTPARATAAAASGSHRARQPGSNASGG
jgi:HlyD family secretion protein